VANTVFCGECGSYLLEDGSAATDPLGGAEEDTLQQGISEAVPNIHEETSNTAGTPSVVRLIIAGTERMIETDLEKTVLFGRQDPSTDTYPEIDLTHDRGAENGVSRRHARLTKRVGRILLEDTGSVNGTFINGDRMAPYLPQVVHDGDQIKLGKLVIKVEFD
jgi:pSer/pThr/pTyr-binding forkhead associated (FHA) protein